MADGWGVSASIWIGALVCLVGVVATRFLLPRFWDYRSSATAAAAVGNAEQVPRAQRIPALGGLRRCICSP
jgi:hypothetical protein